MRKLLFLFLSFTVCTAYAVEYTVKTVPNPITANANAFVSNPDGILKTETVDQINQALVSLRAATGAEVAVVAVNSIGQADYFTFANELFTEWKIGKAKQDNGLLILFVLDQRKVKFEVGYGLEGVLTDAMCKRIQMQTMIPEFKNGNYDAGMLAGIQAAISMIKQEPVVKEQKQPIAWDEVLPIALGVYLLLVLLAWILIVNATNKVKQNAQYKTNLARYKALKAENSAISGMLAIGVPIIGFVLIFLFFESGFYSVASSGSFYRYTSQSLWSAYDAKNT